MIRGLVIAIQEIDDFERCYCFAGALLEATGSFTAPFIVSGCMLALGGIICLPARRIAAWEAKRIEVKKKKLAEAAKA